MVFELGTTQAFMDQLFTLPMAQIRQINRKIEILRQDPHPDGHQRTLLKHQKHRIYRLRSGDYRILYHFNESFVRLLGVDARSDVYEGIDDFTPENLPSVAALDPIDFSEPGDATDPAIDQPWLAANPIVPDEPAPEPIARRQDVLTHPITERLLTAMAVPADVWPRINGITTLDGLLSADIEPGLLERLFNITTQPNIDRLLQAPVYELTNSDDLDRLADGDLVTLLLHLDPDQERLVGLAVNAGGPVLIKGGPGSGKTTIAVRRVARVVEALRAEGVAEPRILFTTYTNALVSTTRQLLARALGDDAALVTVETADRFVRRIVADADGAPNFTSSGDVLAMLPKARLAAGHPSGEGSIGRMSDTYLETEIMSVIVARELPDLAAYKGIERTGRRVPLRREQRAAVWAVWEQLDGLLRAQKKVTWPMMRRRAVELVRAGHPATPKPYDAILVDEVQDLDPTVIRLLTELCPKRSRLFLTADANQSIYGGSFNWKAIHTDLRFQGRSGNLTRTHRTTYEIVRAASRYLATDLAAPLDEIASVGDTLSADRIADQFPRRGPDPVIETVTTDAVPAALVRHIHELAATERVGLGGVAILVPTSSYGEVVARELNKLGVRAEYARKDTLDLSAPTVKITTLHGAKGLEFPIVVLAGLHVEIPPSIQRLTEDEAAEV